MFNPNFWLSFQVPYLVTVVTAASLGATSVRLSSNRVVSFPAGKILTFGGVQVTLVEAVTIKPAPADFICIALTAAISAGANNLIKVNNNLREPYTETVVTASVEEENKSIPEGLPGVDVRSLYLSGRIVNPRTFPQELKALLNQSVIKCEYQRSLDVRLKGQYLILPAVGSRLGLDSFFGDYLSGWFQPAGGV
jgi:hypothetical protein